MVLSRVSLTIDLPVPADRVWETIGGFNDLAKWHPAVAGSEETKSGNSTVRTLHLHGGGTLVERLEAIDDKAHSYSYSILEGPLPVTRYRATLQISEKSDGNGCRVEWSSEFEPSGAPESDVVKVVRGIYEAGFGNLRKIFGA